MTVQGTTDNTARPMTSVPLAGGAGMVLKTRAGLAAIEHADAGLPAHLPNARWHAAIPALCSNSQQQHLVFFERHYAVLTNVSAMA
jgi:tRNA G37 N-methylase TrmD